MARSRQVPLVTGLSWVSSYVSYYYFFQLAAPILILLCSFIPSLYPDLANELILEIPFNSWFQILSISQLIIILLLHIVHLKGVQRLNSPHQRSLSLKCLDILFTPIVILAYSVVSFLALHEMAIKGRQVCKHEPSAKEGLALSNKNQDNQQHKWVAQGLKS